MHAANVILFSENSTRTGLCFVATCFASIPLQVTSEGKECFADHLLMGLGMKVLDGLTKEKELCSTKITKHNDYTSSVFEVYKSFVLINTSAGRRCRGN